MKFETIDIIMYIYVTVKVYNSGIVIQTGHGGRNQMEHELNAKYNNITREGLMIYLNLREPCQKKGNSVKKGLVVKSIISSEMNSCCQVDLIHMQAQHEGNFRFILVYRDPLSKYVLFKPLTHTHVDVAYNIYF